MDRPESREIGASPMPGTEGERRPGLGYVIGFLIVFGMVIASFVGVFTASDETACIRAGGLLLVSFGIAFAFGVAYHALTRRGVPWSISLPGSHRSGVLDPTRNRIGYWLLLLTLLLVSASMVGLGVWFREHAGRIGAAIRAGM